MAASPAQRTKSNSTPERLLRFIDGLLIHLPFLGVKAEIRAGRRAFRVRNWPVAATHYKNALGVAPDNPTVWVQYGHALKEKGERAEAEKAYYEALKRRPNYADTYVQLGHVTKLMGRLNEAAAHYQRAVQLQPNRMDAVQELKSLDMQLIDRLGGADLIGAGPLQVRNAATASKVGTSIALDVTSLVRFFRAARQPTGIQRVQIEIVSALRRSPPPHVALSVCYFSGDDGCWFELPEAEFAALRALATAVGSVDEPEWQEASVAFETALGDQPPAAFPIGTFLINLGAPWDLPDYFLALRSVIASCQLTYVPLVYDLIPLASPENCRPELVELFVGWVGNLFAHTDRMMAISQATKDHVLAAGEVLGQSPRDVQVIRLDTDCRTPSEIGDATDTALLAELGIADEPFVLFVSAIEPRKNHQLAFSAWLQLIRTRGVERTPRLVCVGGRGWMHETVLPMLKASKLLQSKVLLLNGLSDGHLAALYRQCLFSLYPSKFEGWGLPVTESLCYGKPVLTTRSSSLPEAGGEFADYFDVNSETDLLRQLDKLIGDDAYRRQRARFIAEHFRPRSWSELATEIVETIVRWQGEGNAPGAGTLALSRGEGSVRFKLGRLYPLTQNREISIWPGMITGEILRGGTGWWPLDAWGCWTKEGGAYLTFSTEATSEPLRGYIGLKGMPSAVCPYLVEIPENPPIKGIVGADETRWIPFVLPARPSLGIVKITIKTEGTEDLSVTFGKHDRRVVSIGVIGLMLCKESDVRSRMNMLEAIQFGDVSLAVDRPPEPFGPFPLAASASAG